MYTSDNLIESSALRAQLIDRVEVLSKVKALLLIPGLEMMSMRMIADFYEVETQTIRKTFIRHQEEVERDGVRMLSLSQIEANVQDVRLLKKPSDKGVYVTLGNGQEMKMHSKTTYFSPRAVLRIGMLLRDSEVAKEVRTQLLNVLQTVEPEKRTEAIDEEGTMLLAIIRAGSPELMAVELGKYRDFMNRHIARIEEEKAGLATELAVVHNEIVTWTPKQVTNRLIASIGYKLGNRPDIAWSKLWQRMYHHHGIGIRHRNGGKTLISRVREDEWEKVLREVYALAKEVGVDVVRAVGEVNAKSLPGFVA